MNIKKCKYVNNVDVEGKKIPDSAETIELTVIENGKDVLCTVPISEDNTDYAEIMRQVEAGELTIEKGDE